MDINNNCSTSSFVHISLNDITKLQGGIFEYLEKLLSNNYYKVENEINGLPHSSGCYIFTDKNKKILYIGKSKNLKNRVRSYFLASNKNSKVMQLIGEAINVQIITTDSESEALILECMLIKLYMPKYNADLKKDKKHFFLRIGKNEAFPSFTVVNNIDNNDKSKYIGTFYKKEHVENAIMLLNSVWNIPTCFKADYSKIPRPCLQYDLKKCVAPCGIIDVTNYKKIVKEIIDFFDYKNNTAISRLHKEMKSYSAKLEFEKAQETVVKIQYLEKMAKRIKRLDIPAKCLEFIYFFRAYNEQEFQIFYVNNNEVLGWLKSKSLDISKDDLLKFVRKIKENDIDEIAKYTIKFQYLQEIRCDKMYAIIDFSADIDKCVDSIYSEYKLFLV